MTKVYGYIRVSTLTQVKHGLGLKTQEEAISDYCQKNKLELIQIFKDEGISGTIADRHGLTDLLSSFNGINKVIVLNSSRLWRNETVKVLVHRELKKAKSDVISIEQPNYSIYSKDPNDFLINGMMELLDQYERMSISLKLVKGRRTRVKQGNKGSGAAPLGYMWNSKKEIVIDQNKKHVVERIFKKYIECQSVERVKKHINEHNYKTSQNKLFTNTSIKRILKNQFYRGIVKFGNIETQGNHVPIINNITFGKTQKALRIKHNS